MPQTITVTVSETDYAVIMAAISRRQQFRCLPDIEHDDCCLRGRLLSEVCIGWMEQMGYALPWQDSDDPPEPWQGGGD